MLSELRQTLEFLFDDGVSDEQDQQLAQYEEVHANPTSHDALALLGHLRTGLVAACPELAFMGDIADGTKHAALDRPRKTVLGTAKYEGAFDQSFDFSFDTSRLELHLANGAVVPFRPCLDAVAEFWQRYFPDELGGNPESPPEPLA